jgi:hypothetical protein
METHTFIGTIHPERTSITVNPFKILMSNEDGTHKFTLNLAVHYSQIVAIVEFDPSKYDVWTMKNTITHFIDKYTGVYDFLNGTHHIVEIKQHIDQNENITTFPACHPSLYNRIDQDEKTFSDIFLATGHPKYKHIQNSMLDLSRAIHNVHDTVFYCYRAIESLMQFFLQTSKNKSEAWDKLWAANNIDRDFILFMKEKHADSCRHGDHKDINSEERNHILNISFFIVEKTVNYILEKEGVETRINRKNAYQPI